ncbi:FAD binding domain-containing protein, partial [Albidovulum sp.]
MSHHLPTDLGEALALLDRRAGPVVSGGTDFYPALGPGKAPDEIIDISRVEGLSGIVMGADEIRFGATTTWSEIAAAAHLPPAFDALRQAAREVGSIQIQNAGTIAGNLCNASPAADGVPPLMVLGAEVELESAARGRRRLPLAAFVTGVRQVARQPDELVTAVIVPRPDPAARSAFVKLGSRRYLVISIAMAAALVRRA